MKQICSIGVHIWPMGGSLVRGAVVK